MDSLTADILSQRHSKCPHDIAVKLSFQKQQQTFDGGVLSNSPLTVEKKLHFSKFALKDKALPTVFLH